MGAITKIYPRTSASVAKARAFVRAHLSDDDAYLLTSEAAQNAVRYGHGDTFAVTVTTGRAQVRVTVTNDGRADLSRNAAMPGLDAEGGRGMPLMAALAADHGCTVTGDRTSVWFSFPSAR